MYLLPRERQARNWVPILKATDQSVTLKLLEAHIESYCPTCTDEELYRSNLGSAKNIDSREQAQNNIVSFVDLTAVYDTV